VPVWIVPIRDGWLAYARPMYALSLRADIDGRDSLDGYRNRSRYYQGIAHEVPIRAVAATVMYVQGQNEKYSERADIFRSSTITDILGSGRKGRFSFPIHYSANALGERPSRACHETPFANERPLCADCVEEVGGPTVWGVARNQARVSSFALRPASGRALGSALPAFGGSEPWQRGGTRLEHQTDLSA
jgi:hypothetical protein